jgi:hypothetical protein
VDGEIDCLDPGGFGAVTITKSIVIDCGATLGSVLVAGTHAIIVNGAATDRVILRNLSINGMGTGLNGIYALSVGTLHIENVAIRGMSGVGIYFGTAANSKMTVDHSVVRDNGSHGIYVVPNPGMTAVVAVTESKLTGNASAGIRVDDGGKATVSDTALLNNGSNGATAASLSGGAAEITLERVVTAGNGSGGVVANGPLAVIRMSNVTTVNNTFGLNAPVNGASLVTFGNNRAAGNSGGNGSATSTAAQF